jgi:hypothetical protein
MSLLLQVILAMESGNKLTDEVEVDILKPEPLERLVERLTNVALPVGPELRGDEKGLAIDARGLDGFPESLFGACERGQSSDLARPRMEGCPPRRRTVDIGLRREEERQVRRRTQREMYRRRHGAPVSKCL